MAVMVRTHWRFVVLWWAFEQDTGWQWLFVLSVLCYVIVYNIPVLHTESTFVSHFPVALKGRDESSSLDMFADPAGWKRICKLQCFNCCKIKR